MTAGRRGFAWIALGAAAFTVYGSLVPFQFHALAPADAVGTFRAVLATGVRIESRSDAIANVMLGVPLGFALLGFACADRNWPRRKIAARGVLLLPACALFASAVEFSQLYTTGRTCSASDILAQTVGAAVGMIAWGLAGQALTDRFRAVWTRADLNAAGRILLAYVVLLGFIQTLPFDVSASPANLYRKVRDGGVIFTPFGEFTGLNDGERWKAISKLAKLAGLYLPVGLLAARVTGRGVRGEPLGRFPLKEGRIEQWSIVRVALAALGLAVCLEAVQLLVQSRTPSATDVVVGAVSAVVGWYAGRVHHEGLAVPFAVSWGIVWLAGMTPVTQSPPGTPRLESPRAFDWWPGMPLESGDPLNALEEMLTKLVLFGLLGVVVAAWRLPPRTKRGPGGSVPLAVGIAAALGLLAAGFFEAGQRWHDTHTPCVTDVLLGGLGAALGVLVASRAK